MSAQHLYPSCFQPAFSSMGRCEVIFHPFLSTPHGIRVGSSWVRYRQLWVHLQRVPVPKSSIENTLRPGLTSLSTLSHVHLNMLARVPQSIQAGADLPKGKPGAWKSHFCALASQCWQVLHGLQHAENCSLLYLPQNAHFFSAISPPPLSLLGLMELTPPAPSSTKEVPCPSHLTILVTIHCIWRGTKGPLGGN